MNLAVVTLGLGFLVSEVVFANPNYLGGRLDGGTRIGRVKLFGMKVDAFNHPHAWAAVSLVVLRAPRAARRQPPPIAHRPPAHRGAHERAGRRVARHLGVRRQAVRVRRCRPVWPRSPASSSASRARSSPTPSSTSSRRSTASGYAVIGGLGYVLGAVFGAPNAIGGFGTRIIEDWIGLENQWDLIIGSLILFVILIVHQNGIADVVTHDRRLWEKLHLVARRAERAAPSARRGRAGRRRRRCRSTGLTVRFGSVVAVDDVSMEVRPGEVVGLIGPNGAGKTTLIDAVTGFVPVSGGSIALDDRRIDRLNATQRARLGLRRSFQSLELFEDISVEENIRAGSDLRASRLSWVTDLFWPGRHDLPPTAVAAVREFELEPHLDETPEELPYGRRRLVGIARTVASGPSVVMLDEPAAGLDENESAELARLIRRLADERNMGVLLVEHDVGLVMSTCDRVVVIDFGRVIASGTPAEIRGDQAVRDAYLGHADAGRGGRRARDATP